MSRNSRYVGFLVGAAALLVACGGNDDTTVLRTQVAVLQTQAAQPTAPPVPDRVVGIEWRCTRGAMLEIHEEFRGVQACAANEGGSDVLATGGQKITFWNRRQELTVRTSFGTSYIVSVSLATKVAVGDEWPPK